MSLNKFIFTQNYIFDVPTPTNSNSIRKVLQIMTFNLSYYLPMLKVSLPIHVKNCTRYSRVHKTQQLKDPLLRGSDFVSNFRVKKHPNLHVPVANVAS